MDDTPQMPSRLPVWKTVGSCYRALWNRQIPLMPFIWPILAIGVINMWFGDHVLRLNENFQTPVEQLSQNHLFKFLYPIVVIDLLFFSSLFVSWLRYVVRGEWPMGAYIKLAFWKFIGLVTSLTLFGCIIYSFVFFIASFQAGVTLGINLDHNQVDNFLKQTKILPNLSIHAFCQFVSIIFFALLFTNCYLKIAATAVGDHLMSWRRSRQLIKGNKLRIVLANILTSMPYYAFDKIASHYITSSSFSLFFNILGTVLLIYQTIALATLMGITYRTLVGTHLHLQQPTEAKATS